MTNAEKMLAFAREQLGELYDIGDHGPDLWDCSGLTMEMVELMGLKWSHSSHYQWYDNIKASGDFSSYGEIETLPPNEFAFLFKYGDRSSGKGKGMIHVGVYDGITKHQIQAGGNGKKVTLADGTRKSTVSEDDFTPSYWDYWAHVKGQDDEYTAEIPSETPQDAPETTMPTLRYGSAGEEVKVLQNLLNRLGEDLKVDGKFGVNTEAAVRAFQALNNLKVDGIVGPITWNILLPDETPTPVPLYAVTIYDQTAAERDSLIEQYDRVTFEQQN